MKLKKVGLWVEGCGISPAPWVNGDWQAIMDLLSRLLADHLLQRKQSEGLEDITFKISFDAMMQMAEDVLGIPLFIVQEDLPSSLPNINLALLTCVVCIRNSIDIKPEKIKKIIPPKLVFEARCSRNTNVESVSKCIACNQHVFIVERVIIGKAIYHRKCFRCSYCKKLLHRGIFRFKNTLLECIEHWADNLLSNERQTYHQLNSSYVQIKPIPPPKPKNFSPRQDNLLSMNVNRDRTIKEENLQLTAILTKSHGDCNSNQINGKEITGIATSGPFLDSSETIPRLQHAENGSLQGDNYFNKPLSICSNVNCEIIPDDPSVLPVRPPRPKRESMLLQTAQCEINIVKNHVKNQDVSTKGSLINIADYPGFLNPFDSDEESVGSSDSYEENLNFDTQGDLDTYRFSSDMVRESHDSCNMILSICSKRIGTRLLSTSDRPKSTPPPPPKPPRLCADNKEKFFNTLPRPKKTFYAPLPPVPARRKISFNEIEWDESEVSLDYFSDKMHSLDSELEVIEANGKFVEKALLFAVEQNGSDWVTNCRVDEWIDIIEKRCTLIRKQSAFVRKWMEKYLNELHAEVEYRLRCSIERTKEKNLMEVEYEAKLLELLVEVIDRKNYLIESKFDSSAIIEPKLMTKIKHDKESRQRMKKRLRKLKKRLIFTKESGRKSVE